MQQWKQGLFAVHTQKQGQFPTTAKFPSVGVAPFHSGKSSQSPFIVVHSVMVVMLLAALIIIMKQYCSYMQSFLYGRSCIQGALHLAQRNW